VTLQMIESLDDLGEPDLQLVETLIRSMVQAYPGIRSSDLTKHLLMEIERSERPIQFSIHGLPDLIDKMIKSHLLHRVEVKVGKGRQELLFPQEATINVA
jgi:hypothetical protein